MPGICGIITSFPKKSHKNDLSVMLDRMMHETFYESGMHVNEDLGLYAGWVCHKGSFSNCNPIINEKKDVVLIFFGENFADRESVDQLKGRNHKFDAANAEYLVHLYEEYEDRFLPNLNGWFCGILIDVRLGKTVLFNDRYGMQRIYYYQHDDAFYFSSEAKSLLAVCPELRKIDMRSLGEFLCCDCVLENRTLFSNLHLLPYGSSWSFRHGGCLERKFYFNENVLENQTFLEKEYFYDKLKETLERVVPRYFRSTQDIGVSLTGGLDTRIVMAYADIPHEKVPCYTFGGIYRDSYDVKIAGKVAAVSKNKSQVIRVDRSFLKNFSELAEKTVYITDGNLDVSGAPELYVNRLAREIAPIRMTGNYGSEVLRSIRVIRPSPLNEDIYDSEFKGYVHQAVKTVDGLSANIPLSYTLFREVPWHEPNRFAIEQSQLTPRSPFLDNDLISLMYRAPMEVRENKEMSIRLIRDKSRDLSTIMTDRGILFNDSHFVSLFTQFYLQLLFRSEYYFDYGMPQWLARFNHIMAPLQIEKMFLGRHKFYHFRVWLRDELSDYVKAMLLDERTLGRPYWNREYLVKIVNDHTKGYRNYTMEIIKILTVELTHRLLIEQG